MTRLIAQSLTVALGRRPVLDGLDIALEPGRLTVIVGPNGAGKTTVLKALAGLLIPQRGRVLWGDKPLDAMSAKTRARTIAYLPQSGSLAWPLTVEAVVALGRLPHGEIAEALPSWGREAVAQAIVEVGLEGFEKRSATALSGGEQARVLLARALATRASALIADEPVAALDPRHQLIVLERLKAHARSGAVVVAVMHDLGLAARFSDDIVMMQNGRIRAHGAPAGVMTPERLADIFGIAARIHITDGAVAVIPDHPLPEAAFEDEP